MPRCTRALRGSCDAVADAFSLTARVFSFSSYLCEEGELGEAMIIPARYIGEAEAPIFYFYDDGIRFKKE
jgi:hypothetical protein